MKATHLIIALVVILAGVTLAHAQVGWGSVASDCVAQTTGQNLASYDAVHGVVSFKSGKFGDFKLTCPVRSTHQIAPNAINDMTMTFYNNNGFVGGVNHCYIRADLLRTNLNNQELGGDLGHITTEGVSFTGRNTRDVALTEIMDFNTSYYWVDLELFRDSTLTCNPLLVGTFLQQVIQ